jgi:hypothetical protein
MTAILQPLILVVPGCVLSVRMFYSDYGVGCGLLLARLCDITTNVGNLGSHLRIEGLCATRSVTSHAENVVLQGLQFQRWVFYANSVAVET